MHTSHRSCVNVVRLDCDCQKHSTCLYGQTSALCCCYYLLCAFFKAVWRQKINEQFIFHRCLFFYYKLFFPTPLHSMSVERQPFAIWVRYAHNPQEEKTPQMLLLTKQTKGKGRCSPSRPFLPHFSPSTSPLAVSLNAHPQGRVLKDVVGIGRGQPADLGSCKASTSQIISHFRLHKTTTRRRAWRKRQRKCLSMRRGVPDVTAIDLIFFKTCLLLPCFLGVQGVWLASLSGMCYYYVFKACFCILLQLLLCLGLQQNMNIKIVKCFVDDKHSLPRISTVFCKPRTCPPYLQVTATPIIC